MDEPETRWRALSVLAEDALWQLLAERFLEFISPGSQARVLELGSSGSLAARLRRLQGRVTVADPEQRCLELSRQSADQILLQTRLDQLPLPAHQFEVIVTLTGLWDGSASPGTLNELVRLLQPGGIFGAVFPAHLSSTGSTLSLPETLVCELSRLEALSSTRMPSEALFEPGHPPERSLEYQLRARGFRRIRTIELLGGHFYALKAWR